MLVGHLREIWQYPLKSAAGQKLNDTVVGQAGITGDRCWAIFDADKSEIVSAKRWPELLNLQAELARQPIAGELIYEDAVPDLLVTLPDGESFNSRDPQAEEQLSEFLGRPARIAPLAPPSNSAHYKLAGARTEEDFSNELGLLEGEQIPDFSSTPDDLMAQLAEHATPPGTYFDAFPLHLLTTNSLQYLSDKGGVQAVLPRFRANFLVEPCGDGSGLTENDWVGKKLGIGDMVVSVNSRTVRCSMPSREQLPHQLQAEKSMARAMVDHVERQLGVNLLVEQTGRISVGDEVTLIDGEN